MEFFEQVSTVLKSDNGIKHARMPNPKKHGNFAIEWRQGNLHRSEWVLSSSQVLALPICVQGTTFWEYNVATSLRDYGAAVCKLDVCTQKVNVLRKEFQNPGNARHVSEWTLRPQC